MKKSKFGDGFNGRSLICLNKDASKKIFVATGILVFDFEVTYQYVVEGSKE